MFNNDSRWDRHTPQSGQSYDEGPIDVGVIFACGEMVPKTFVWKKRKYYIQEITYRWKDTRGRDVLHYFSVTDRTNVYLIYLNGTHMHWRLAKVCPLEREGG